jgi:hypothetical protein
VFWVFGLGVVFVPYEFCASKNPGLENRFIYKDCRFQQGWVTILLGGSKIESVDSPKIHKKWE